MTFDTVLMETPATRATSCIVAPIDAPAFPCAITALYCVPASASGVRRGAAEWVATSKCNVVKLVYRAGVRVMEDRQC
ncbi:hypothetical protein GCM10025760_08150 [Microbacterium yannicii]|uniref:Uncharacterized protein n=1 Tax=Microbacterium yannicii TaxID=671622 RepID=A0ABP9M109_9MICO